MEYQVVNEVSLFWSSLVLPIFLGTISLALFMWALGKNNREAIMARFLNEDEYVCQNGVFIPKRLSTRYRFAHKVLSIIGVDSLKPIVFIFLFILFFYGMNRLITISFQPILGYSGKILYASGVDGYMLSNIWLHYPDIKSPDQLYPVIMDLAEETFNGNTHNYIYSIQAFLRFDMLCCVIMLLHIILKRKKAKWINYKLILRLIILLIVLSIGLLLALFVNMNIMIEETRDRCNYAYYFLEKGNYNDEDTNLENKRTEREKYEEIINEDKKRCEGHFYYGAFSITENRNIKPIKNVIKELQRCFCVFCT